MLSIKELTIVKNFRVKPLWKVLRISLVIVGGSLLLASFGTFFHTGGASHALALSHTESNHRGGAPNLSALVGYSSQGMQSQLLAIQVKNHRGIASWTMPRRDPGISVVLYGWPNSTSKNYRDQAPVILGSTTAGNSRTVTITFPLPTTWPDVHEVFQMRTGNTLEFRMEPLAQLPEVPWAALLPLLFLGGLGAKVLQSQQRPRRQ